MEDGRYHWRKQHGHDFAGSDTSEVSSTKTKGHAGGDGDTKAAEFDVNPQKRRKPSAGIMKSTLSKPDRLVRVASRLEHMEEELANTAADKKPDGELPTRAEWESLIMIQSPAGNTGKKAKRGR